MHSVKPTLREQYDDLKDRHEPMLRAVIALVASYDPSDPSECSTLVYDLALSAGISSQIEAEGIVRSWGRPLRSSQGEASFKQVTHGGGRNR